jgi:hypothetical protein
LYDIQYLYIHTITDHNLEERRQEYIDDYSRKG